MIDKIVIVILLIFAVIGYKKGLIRSVVTLLSSVLSLILALFIYPLTNMILKITPLYTSIYNGTLKQVETIDFGKGLQTQGNAILENITLLPEMITEQIKANNNTEMYRLLDVHSLQEYIATFVANIAINLLAIIVTWLIIKVGIMLLSGSLGGIIEHLPVVATFNRAGGLLFGVVKGIFMLSIIGLIIPVFINWPSFMPLYESIEESVLTKWLYNHNLIISIYDYYLMK